MLLDNSQYLSAEALNLINYPEIALVRGSTDSLQLYSMRLVTAIDAYTAGTYDKIDVNITDLQKNIELCRSTCDILGRAPNVCYEILLELRQLQFVMQSLMFVKKRFGSQYIGVPALSTSEGGSGI